MEKKGAAKDPKHTASSVKHGVDGVMTVSRTSPLKFTDDDCSRMN